MKARLTKRTVDAARAGNRDTFIWDTETKGFGLKVTPAGNRVYILQKRVEGRVRRYTIGTHGAPWTPDLARTEAVRLLGLIAAGSDPANAKDAAKRDITVGQLCSLYVDEGCGRKKQSTIDVEGGLIRRHTMPLLGARRLQALDRADVERFMAEVAKGKTATDEKSGIRGRSIVKGGPGTANRTVALLASMLSFAVDRGFRQDNPARGVKPYRPQPRERFLSASELAALGEVLADAEARRENPFAIAAIRLLMFTGCRKHEILSLQWEWIDFERSVLRLPDSKTGAKSVPLGAPALDLLRNVPRVEGNRYVFPSVVGDGHLVGLQKIWVGLRERAGMSDVRLHDLRHSFASVAVAGGDSLYLVGKVLGHTQARTTERYAHLADDPLRAVADRTANAIAAALKGSSAEVVDLKRRQR